MTPPYRLLLLSGAARRLLPSGCPTRRGLAAGPNNDSDNDVWSIGEQEERAAAAGAAATAASAGALGRRSGSRRAGFAGLDATDVTVAASGGSGVGGFRMLVVPGLTKEPAKPPQRRNRHPLLPRCSTMRPARSSWTSVWPTARTFHPAVVPLPVRQGRPSNATENAGISPNKWGNTELVKVPNFLHLTPAHVTAHCAALRHLCQPWPEALNNEALVAKHLPVRVVTTDYLRASNSLRDGRARRVEISLPLDRLSKLDKRSLEKLLSLVSFSNFARVDADPASGARQLRMWSERCPWRQQNYDYLMYALSALYSQSLRREAWEASKAWTDNRVYEFERSPSEEKLRRLPSQPPPAAVADYRTALVRLHRQPADGGVGETHDALRQYGRAVERLLGVGGGGGGGADGPSGKKATQSSFKSPSQASKQQQAERPAQ